MPVKFTPKRSIPAIALWRHLGYTHDLPWSVGLRVEVDGVLQDQVHKVLMRSPGRNHARACAVSCAAAFYPLAGMRPVVRM